MTRGRGRAPRCRPRPRRPPPPGAARRSRSRRARPSARAIAPRGSSSGASRWMALRPVNGRAVWARSPPSAMRTRMVPWQPASTSAPVGSPSTAASPASSSGRVPPQLEQAALGPVDLLARRRSTRSRRPPGSGTVGGQVEHDRQPALHVGGARGPRGCRPRAAAPRCRPAGTVSRCPATTSRWARPSVGPGHHVVADPLDLEPGAGRAARLHLVGQRRLVVAHRGDGHQLGGGGRAGRATARSGAGPVLAQDLVQLRLVVPLALGRAA